MEESGGEAEKQEVVHLALGADGTIIHPRCPAKVSTGQVSTRK